MNKTHHIKKVVFPTLVLVLFGGFARADVAPLARTCSPCHKQTLPTFAQAECEKETNRINDEERNSEGKLSRKKKHKVKFKQVIFVERSKIGSCNRLTNFIGLTTFSALHKFCYASDKVWYLQKTNLSILAPAHKLFSSFGRGGATA